MASTDKRIIPHDIHIEFLIIIFFLLVGVAPWLGENFLKVVYRFDLIIEYATLKYTQKKGWLSHPFSLSNTTFMQISLTDIDLKPIGRRRTQQQ